MNRRSFCKLGSLVFATVVGHKLPEIKETLKWSLKTPDRLGVWLRLTHSHHINRYDVIELDKELFVCGTSLIKLDNPWLKKFKWLGPLPCV